MIPNPGRIGPANGWLAIRKTVNNSGAQHQQFH
jgi:hypothetical protein